MLTVAFVGIMVGTLSACNDSSPNYGGGGAAPATGGTGGSGGYTGESNRPPSISGTGPALAIADSEYVFKPTASDPDGDRLTFWVTGLPSWASFNAATGQVRGTPTAANLGESARLRIGVTDGAANAYLSGFSLQVVATAEGTATLSWEPPSERTDGSALMNLAGYKIYWGMDPDHLSNSVTIDNAGLSIYVIEQLVPATWYFVATSFDANGVESGFSNLASKRIL